MKRNLGNYFGSSDNSLAFISSLIMIGVSACGTPEQEPVQSASVKQPDPTPLVYVFPAPQSTKPECQNEAPGFSVQADPANIGVFDITLTNNSNPANCGTIAQVEVSWIPPGSGWEGDISGDLPRIFQVASGSPLPLKLKIDPGTFTPAASTSYFFQLSATNTADRSKTRSLSATYVTPAAAPAAPSAPTIANATGNVYTYTDTSGSITGRAWDPNFPSDLASVTVDINIDGSYYNVAANKVRPGSSGTGIDAHYFTFVIPTAIRTDNKPHTLSVDIVVKENGIRRYKRIQGPVTLTFRDS
jgi:hypothetical protein